MYEDAGIRTVYSGQHTTIRELEIIRAEKLIPDAISGNKYLSNHHFRLYTVYNKH